MRPGITDLQTLAPPRPTADTKSRVWGEEREGGVVGVTRLVRMCARARAMCVLCRCPAICDKIFYRLQARASGPATSHSPELKASGRSSGRVEECRSGVVEWCSSGVVE